MRSSRGKGGIWVHAKLPDEKGERKRECGQEMMSDSEREEGGGVHYIPSNSVKSSKSRPMIA